MAAVLPTARWAPGLLQRAEAPDGPPPVAHMRPDAAAFRLRREDRTGVTGRRVVLLDDTYVSGTRSQSAAAALQLAGACATLIVPLGRVLRPTAPPAMPTSSAGTRPEPGSSDGGLHRVTHTGQLLRRLPQVGRRLLVTGTPRNGT